jgi:hypothetical protein
MNVCVLALIASFATAPAMAQDVEVSGDAPPPAVRSQKGYAGSAFGSPSAFALGWGGIGGGLYNQTLSHANEPSDASAALSFGLGDAHRWVALDTSVTFATLSDSRGSKSGFGNVGALSFKLSRNIGPGTALAIGVLAASSWGFTKTWEQPTYYFVGTHILPVSTFAGHRPLVLSLGVATSGYETNDRTNQVRTRPFGSAGFYFTRQFSIIADFTGRFANLGISVAPLARYPVTLTLGAVNLTNADKIGRQFGVALGAAFLAF